MIFKQKIGVIKIISIEISHRLIRLDEIIKSLVITSNDKSVLKLDF